MCLAFFSPQRREAERDALLSRFSAKALQTLAGSQVVVMLVEEDAHTQQLVKVSAQRRGGRVVRWWL
jgi:hypothetical protein